ncbi:hypothetical protein Glove_87g116 [Diversispora epigaea]|uniref:Uncharacterized protein n=1 Tax=Diversispora epigaea TaxID=1348612 RepID=A0A397JFL7_9GLOM|nr:hypothetical protein Glove_87g116 [Diversispora epigaea]
MLLSLILTTLVGVSGAAILSAFEKYTEMKDRKNQEIKEQINRDLQQQNENETFESPPLIVTLDVQNDNQCENETKNENKCENDDHKIDNTNLTQEELSITDVTPKTEILPIQKLTSSYSTEDEKLTNLDNKLDELLGRRGNSATITAKGILGPTLSTFDIIPDQQTRPLAESQILSQS